MPHISVKLYPGRSQEMKENLAHKLQECLASESGCWSNDDISVSFEEIGPEGLRRNREKRHEAGGDDPDLQVCSLEKQKK